MTKTGLSRPTAHKKIITNNDMQKIATYLQADDDAQVLQYKVWYSLGVHFVSRGLEFHHQLTLNSFSFHQDDDGREYVTLAHETQQKNVQGGLSDIEAVSDKRMYSTGDVGCPVSALRKLMYHCDPSAPALFCRLKPNASNDIWYTCKALSKRMFSKFMPSISEKAKCNTIYTAHSVRATAINLLSNAGFETRHIMLMSGHRNEASVRSYSRDCSVRHKEVISDTLQSVVDGEHHDALPEPAIPVLPWCPQPSGSVVGVGPLVRAPVHQQPSLPNMSIFNSTSSLSATQGVLGNGTFNNCQFSFVMGRE